MINQYGDQIKRVVYETLGNLGVKDVKITIVDKGALDCTIKARVEGEYIVLVGQNENLPWEVLFAHESGTKTIKKNHDVSKRTETGGS